MKRAINVSINSEELTDEDHLACYIIQHLFTPMLRDQLKQLVRFGPVWDGDVLSKSSRDNLIDLNLASRAMYKEEYGFTVANYHGGRILEIVTIDERPKTESQGNLR